MLDNVEKKIQFSILYYLFVTGLQILFLLYSVISKWPCLKGVGEVSGGRSRESLKIKVQETQKRMVCKAVRKKLYP